MEKVSVSELEAVCCVAFTGDSISGQGLIPAMQVNQNGNMYNGIPSAITFLVCRYNALPLLLQMINVDGNGDKIIDVFNVIRLVFDGFNLFFARNFTHGAYHHR